MSNRPQERLTLSARVSVCEGRQDFAQTFIFVDRHDVRLQAANPPGFPSGRARIWDRCPLSLAGRSSVETAANGGTNTNVHDFRAKTGLPNPWLSLWLTFADTADGTDGVFLNRAYSDNAGATRWVDAGAAAARRIVGENKEKTGRELLSYRVRPMFIARAELMELRDPKVNRFR